MVGDTLRRERESQNLSVRDIEKGTSIRSNYIEAIESGDYDKLPGAVYTKGFIKNYANFLELDGDALVKEFLVEVSATVIPPAEEISNPVENTEPAPAEESIADKISNLDSPDMRKYLVAAVVLIAFLIGGFLYNSGDSVQEDNTVTQQETVQPAPVETQQVDPAPVPTPPPQPVIAQVQDGVNVKATFSDDCWTQVVTDGSLTYEGTINAGQVLDWKGDKSIYVVLGNAGAANFIVNGQNIGAIGKDGEVVDRTFAQ